MSDFQVQIGGDFSELLRGFQQLESRAQQSGTAVGKGLGDGILGYSTKSLAALQAELSRLQQRQVKVAVDSTAFEKTGQQIRQVQGLIDEVQRRRVTLGVDDRSITSLQAKLAQLQGNQLRLDVDSREFADAQRQINALESDLNDVSRRKLLIDADPSSVLSLRAKLSDLQGQLERVAIGSDRFQELSDAIRETERELARAGESTDQFRILDGVVQGLAFSLSNAVIDGARQAVAALGSVVSEFAQLDTELRKAASASGEAGAYDELAASVDRVGIEASGTTLEVAQLATELVRGGMTVDQANQSLAAIVRGAEATGTSFDNMGSVVSASLKSFGLEASDAQRVVDALVTGANASAASAEGMGMAFKYAAPVAKLLGVSIEDLALATGLLTNAGIDASEAGVTLRNGLSKLASAAPNASGAMSDLTGQSAMAAKAMQSLGVDIYNTNGTLKPMEQTLLQLRGAFEKLDPASKVRLAANLFGGEDDGAKWLALLNQSEEEIRRMAATLSNTKGSTDVARDAMTGFELKLKQLDGTLNSIGVTFGKVAAGALLPFIDAANLIVGAVVALPGPVKALVAGVTLLTGAYVAATVAQIAFTRALQAEVVQSAIAGVTSLATALRTRLLADVARATAAWGALSAAFTTTSSNAIIASLAQIAAGLRNLKAAEAAAGFQKLAAAMRLAAIEGKAALGVQLAAAVAGLQSKAWAAAVDVSLLGKSLRGVAASSAATEAGLSGVTLLLQRGMTTGATGAATATTGLSRVLAGLAGLTGSQLASGLGAAASGIGSLAVAAAPVAIAFATLAAGVVAYNASLEEQRRVAEPVGREIAALGESLRSAGVEFQDFGRQGGPVEELLRALGRAFQDAESSLVRFGAGLKDLPIIGGAAKTAIDALAASVKFLKEQNIYEWSKQVGEGIRIMWTDFTNSNAITDTIDNLEQLKETLRGAGERTDIFVARLKSLDQVPVGTVEALTKTFNEQRQQISNTTASLEGMRAQYLAAIEAVNQKTAATEIERQQQEELVSWYQYAANATGANIKVQQDRLKLLETEGARLGLVVDKLKQQELTTATLTQRVLELNAAVAAGSATQQVGQALLGYAQELAGLEQSRFNIVKARGDYELQQVQEKLNKELAAAKARGASDQQLQQMQKAGEAELEAIRQRNRATEQQALQAKATALVQQQALERAILVIKQENARTEAQSGVNSAQLELLKAKIALQKEESGLIKDPAKIAAAQLAVQQATLEVQARQNSLNLLGQIQPLESLMAEAKAQSARNDMIAEGATKGMAVNLSASAPASQALAQAAANAGYELQRAADGSLQLVRSGTQAANSTAAISTSAQGASTALGQAANQSGTLATNTGDGARRAGDLATAADKARGNLDNSAKAAGGVQEQLGKAGDAASTTATKTGQVGTAAADSANRTRPLVDALGTAGLSATTIATADMAGNLSRASGSAGGIRNAMVAAATAARDFYNWLAQASGLPGSRWTGGPVEAGQAVRINDGPGGRSLGQEAFLSAAGKLSLINRPANSLWTPPTSGVVIPAGITKDLKARGMFDSGRAASAAVASRGVGRAGQQDMAAGLARQAVAIGKLQQSVDRLVDKRWDVHVQLRNDGSGARYLGMLNGMA